MSAASPPWATRILTQLEIEPVDIDIAALKRIAENLDASHSTDQLVVGFLAGYAAGLAQGADMASFERAHAASLKFMDKITATDESKDS